MCNESSSHCSVTDDTGSRSSPPDPDNDWAIDDEYILKVFKIVLCVSVCESPKNKTDG